MRVVVAMLFILVLAACSEIGFPGIDRHAESGL